MNINDKGNESNIFGGKVSSYIERMRSLCVSTWSPCVSFCSLSVAVLIKGRKKWQSKGLHGNEPLADAIDAVDVDAVDADAVNPPLAAGHQDLCICTRWAFQVAVSHDVSQPRH